MEARSTASGPASKKEQLYEGRDLAVTTDFRAVLSELVAGQLGTKDLTQVFPGYRAGDPLGLLKSSAMTSATKVL